MERDQPRHLVAAGARERIRSLPESVDAQRCWRRVVYRGPLPSQSATLQIINFEDQPILDLTYAEAVALASALIDACAMRQRLATPAPPEQTG